MIEKRAPAETKVSEAGVRVRELMQRIAVASGIEARVEVREDPDGVWGNYLGDELGLLIGPRGQTIDAIQHLAYRTAFRGPDARKGVTVDASGYRERRAVSLCADADQAAETAIREHRPVSLEALSPPERKVIHEHLKERYDVETFSEGQEPKRHLVVAPVVN